MGVGSHANGTTMMGTVYSIVCTTVGAGIIALPSGFALGGWIGALLALLTIATFSAHTAKLLAACMHMAPNGKPIKSYEDIGGAVWGRTGVIVVGILQSITLFGVCTVFLILIVGRALFSIVCSFSAFLCSATTTIFGVCTVSLILIANIRACLPKVASRLVALHTHAQRTISTPSLFPVFTL
jgi:amino acid permease